jgi:hypothetical protein
MHQAQHHHHRAADSPERPRLRAIGVICDRCGRESTPESARLEAWHSSRDEQQIVCRGCVELYALETDDEVLFWPVCGHPVEDGALLYSAPVCLICEG